VKLFELSDYIDVLAVVSEADLDLIMVGGNGVRVNLLGCFIEGYVGSNQALGKEAEAHFGKMTQAALEFARGSFATCSEEHNWYEHFELLMRHPVINAGVQMPLGIITGFPRISSVRDRRRAGCHD
jgi:hypothetical protein